MANIGDILHSDTFTRADGAVGTASDGHSWTVDGSVTWSITGNTLKATNTTFNGRVKHGGADTGNLDVTFDVLVSTSASGTLAGIQLRGASGNCYRLAWAASSASLELSKFVNNAYTLLASTPISLSTATWYTIRCVMVGSDLRAKMWKRGTSEPASWMIQASDTTWTSGPCSFMFQAVSLSTYAKYDNLTLKLADTSSFNTAKTRTLGSCTAALSQVGTISTLYGSAQADGTLTSAGAMATMAGGIETTKKTTTTGTAGKVYAEVLALGGTSAGVTTIPATPTGKGWVYTPGSGTFAYGNWQATVTISASLWGGSSAKTTLTLRVFQKSGSRYIKMGSLSIAVTGIAKTTYPFPLVAMPATRFFSLDSLYFDLWWYDNTTDVGGDNPVLYEATSSAAGVVSDFQITPPPFDTTLLTPAPRWLPTSVPVLRVNQGVTAPASAAIAAPEYGLHVRRLPDRTEVQVALESLSVTERAEQRTTAEFAVNDLFDANVLCEGQRFEITEDGLRLFHGFVDSLESERVPANTPKVHTVHGKDERWLAEKRLYEGEEFAGETAGSIAITLIEEVLIDEGVRATYAQDVDTSGEDFSEGTLSYTTTSDEGNLILAEEGVAIDVTEDSNAEFVAGTLDGVAAVGKTLTLAPTKAIYMSGTVTASKCGVKYAYRTIWRGTQSIASGDTLHYDIWIPSTSRDAKAGVDLVFGDPVWLRNSSQKDQNKVSAKPSTDLSSRAKDQWYHREISLSPYAGMQLWAALIGLCGTNSGKQAVYVKNIGIYNSTGGLKKSIFLNVPQVQAHCAVSGGGYTNVSVRVVTTYPQEGKRTSPAYASDTMRYARDSLVQWVVDVPDPELCSFTMSAQIGESPPVECEPNTPIPNLPAGSFMSGKDVRLIESFTMSGPDPTRTPVLKQVHLLVQPAYYQSKYDVEDLDDDAASLGTGILSNVTAESTGLHLSGSFIDWSDGSLDGETLTGNVGGSPAADVDDGLLQLSTGNTYAIRYRLDKAGQWQNFVAEVDIYITGPGNHGLILRTESSAWSNSDGYYAYFLYLDPTTMQLWKGSAGGSKTLIQSAAATFDTDNWYRLKVIANGTNIQGWVDEHQYINATDLAHNHTGYLGPGFQNDGTARATGSFTNFGVMDLSMTGSRTHPALDLSAVGTVSVSQITWDADVPNVCDLLIEASLDGGATWLPCTNAESIPGLDPGVDVSSTSLLIRETFTTENANASATLYGIWVRVNGQSFAGGTRMSHVLPISDWLEFVGSSSISWDADVPELCALTVEATSDEGQTWAEVQNGGPIPGVSDAPPVWSDTFETDQSDLYVNT